MKRGVIFSIIGVVLALLLMACGPSGSKAAAPAATPRGNTGTITTGATTKAASGEVAATGGTISVNDASSPLDGFEITVPADAYSDTTDFTVSYAPVTNQTFGDSFDPITPLITVDNGGGYADDLLQVKIPVQVPDGKFAMGFIYDEATKQLEGLPLLSQDADSITVATRHFSSFVVSLVNAATLATEIDSGFQVGVDDWQFTNYGSYLAPGGHCSGQTLTAMWYYITRPDGPDAHLYGRYDNNGNQPATPDFWYDDSYGYRLASVIQNEEHWDSLSRTITNDYVAISPETTMQLVAASILVTGQPQYIAVWNTKTQEGHALIAYKVAGNRIYVADPNYPGEALRYIEYDNGAFKPYSSAASANQIDKGDITLYDHVGYVAKSALIDWDTIAMEWQKLKNGTIGDGVFPSYEISRLDAANNELPLKDGYVSSEPTLRAYFNADINGEAYAVRNQRAITDPVGLDGGIVEIPLQPGDNLIGFYISGLDEKDNDLYIDFKYYHITYKAPASKPWTLVKTIIQPDGGTATEMFVMTYDSTVDNNRITRKGYFDPKYLTKEGDVYYRSAIGGGKVPVDPNYLVTSQFDFDQPQKSYEPGAILTLEATGTIGYTGQLPSPYAPTDEMDYVFGTYTETGNGAFQVTPDAAAGFSLDGGSTALELSARPDSGADVTKDNTISLKVPEDGPQQIAIQVQNIQGLTPLIVTWVYEVK